MAITLQAFAKKNAENNTLEVTVRKVYNFNQFTSETYILPTKISEFEKLPDKLFTGNAIPSFISKADFKNNFVKFTLDQVKKGMSHVIPATLTNHYKQIFKITPDIEAKLVKEALDAAAADSISFTTSQADIDEYIATEPLGAISDDDEASNVSENEYPEEDGEYDDSALGYEDDEDGPTNYPLPSPPDVQLAPPLSPPAAPGMRPVKDYSSLGTRDSLLVSQFGNDLNGTGGVRLIEPVAQPVVLPGMVNIASENNSGAMFGRDEFYGLRGHTKSGACYIYAGRSPNNIQTEIVNPESNNPSPDTATIPNNLVTDAAYLYLSQKADVDDLLKVTGGTYTKHVGVANARKGISLAAIKADDVVIMARQSGIRLITATDKVSSNNSEQFAKFGVDLIAGNNDGDLQPLVKGDNLIVYLEGLSTAVKELRSVVYSFLTNQIEVNAAFGTHQHYDAFSILIGKLATGKHDALFGGKNFISQEAFQGMMKGILNGAKDQMGAISGLKNNINNDNGGLGPMGEYRILSEKNRTN